MQQPGLCGAGGRPAEPVQTFRPTSLHSDSWLRPPWCGWGVPSLAQALAPGPSEPGLGRLDPTSPQAAGGIEEDLGVHGLPGQVAVAVTPAREGDDDAVSQHGERLGDQLLLQLVGGGQVPEQPWGTAGSAGPGPGAAPLDPGPHTAMGLASPRPRVPARQQGFEGGALGALCVGQGDTHRD